MTTEADLRWWLSLAPELDFQYAKSMPNAPHSYVVKDKTLIEPYFSRAVRVIRTFGQPGKFYSRTNIYLTDPERGVKWWTMGYDVPTTKIINQADARQVYGVQDAPRTYGPRTVRDKWDALACDYDTLYPFPGLIDEVRSAVIGLMGAIAPRTLDVGCGTGRPLDANITASSLYTGIDSSQAMLNELVRKVNLARKRMPRLIPALAETVEFDEHYDLGLAVCGSASLVEFSVIERMTRCCDHLVLMPYSDGDNAAQCRELPGAVVRSMGEFDLVTVKG